MLRTFVTIFALTLTSVSTNANPLPYISNNDIRKHAAYINPQKCVNKSRGLLCEIDLNTPAKEDVDGRYISERAKREYDNTPPVPQCVWIPNWVRQKRPGEVVPVYYHGDLERRSMNFSDPKTLLVTRNGRTPSCQWFDRELGQQIRGYRWGKKPPIIVFRPYTFSGSIGGTSKSEIVSQYTVTKAVMQWMDVKKVHWVGQLGGGQMALLMAIMFPNESTKVTVSAPGGYGSCPDEYTQQQCHSIHKKSEYSKINAVSHTKNFPKVVVTIIYNQKDPRVAPYYINDLTENLARNGVCVIRITPPTVRRAIENHYHAHRIPRYANQQCPR